MLTRKALSRLLLVLTTALALPTSACTSELDGKPAAQVNEAKGDKKADKKADAKADSKADAKADSKAEAKTSGASRRRTFEIILGDPIEPDRLAHLMKRKDELVQEVLARDGLRCIPGAPELIEGLKKNGFRLAVASSSRHAEQFLKILEIRKAFEVVVDATSELPSKPEPDLYLETARQLGVVPKDCLAIEDSPPGVASAKAAGMRCLAVTTTAGVQRLRSADRVVGSLYEIDTRAPG